VKTFGVLDLGDSTLGPHARAWQHIFPTCLGRACASPAHQHQGLARPSQLFLWRDCVGSCEPRAPVGTGAPGPFAFFGIVFFWKIL